MLTNQIQLVSRFKLFQNGGMEDFSDRLSSKFSCLILLLLGSVILFKQYWIRPISCYFSVDPGGSNLIQYIESYCYVHGIIPISFNGTMPTKEKDWLAIDKTRTLYYQWVPFALFGQAVMCYIPHIIWRFFRKRQSNADFNHIIQRANRAIDLDEEKRKFEVIHLAQALKKLLFQNRESESKSAIRREARKIHSKIIEWIKMGIPLIIYYLFIKILYIANALGQIYLMKSFLRLNSSDYKFFGSKILNDIIQGKNWQVSQIFPRIGFCLGKFRHTGSTNYVTAQCALPLNMLNEKVYIFLWFWMLILSIISIISLCVWIIRMVISRNKTDFLNMYLKLSGDYTYKELRDKRKIVKFEKKFLQNDGMFFLRILATNVGDLITAEVVSQLWKIYAPCYEDKELDMEKLKKSLDNRNSSCSDGRESRRVSV